MLSFEMKSTRATRGSDKRNRCVIRHPGENVLQAIARHRRETGTAGVVIVLSPEHRAMRSAA